MEINSTYYGIPKPEVFERFARLTPDDFLFTVKVPSSVTHDRTNPRRELDIFETAITPLKDSGKLHCLLVQFPKSFKYDPHSVEYIRKLKDIFDEKLFVEFRQNDWIRDSVFELLRNMNIGIVSVDEPDLPGLLPKELWNTEGTIYYRLHSRDASKWYQGRDARYDYYYTDEELEQIKKSLSTETKKKLKALVFFNNCHQGSAMKNAEKLKLMLGQDAGPPSLGL